MAEIENKAIGQGWRQCAGIVLCAIAVAIGLAASATEAHAEEEYSLATIPSPFASTARAATVTASKAVLWGEVFPGGKVAIDTKYRFEYGVTTSYGSYSSEGDAGSEIEGRAVSAEVGGLSSGTTYHYRLVAWNSKGTCYGADSTLRTSGGPVLAPSAVYEPASGRNAFYAGSGNKVAEWWVNGSAWEDVELAGGEPVAADSSPSAVYEPSGSGRNIFYDGTTGSSGAIWQWYVNSGHWEDAELWSFNHSTSNEAVSAGTSPSAVYEPSGSGRNVFYIGSNGKMWDWSVNKGAWENVELHAASGGGSNEAALADTSPTAIYESGSGRNVFYVGANGAIWEWWVNKGAWENVELHAASDGGSNETAAISPSAVSEPSSSGRNVFYIGNNGKMWEWWVNKGAWEDVELHAASDGGANEPGETTPSSMYDASGSGRNVFYEGANGAIWEWWVNKGAWENVELGTVNDRGANEPIATEDSPSAIYDPSSHRNAFYRGSNGKMWDWWVNGSHWEDVEL